MGLFRKSDKECAREQVAAVIVTGGDEQALKALADQMTTDEIRRGLDYLASGKKITGR